mmetsp:Transcript_2802/g.3986  ORF Transcript_2802/g.3986 Transcript_2802/m.3986 type:complete len:80 (-) Transcript_2802:1685-1924(-)
MLLYPPNFASPWQNSFVQILNPCWNSFVQGKIWDTLKNKNDQNLGLGSSYGLFLFICLFWYSLLYLECHFFILKSQFMF